ncbi:MAG: LysR family transcriptional regulator [Candidatus Sericytochromatia bacterium]
MLNLKTEWIRYFIVLSESANFSIASKKLDISVSALVQIINNLENTLKIKLITRGKKNNTLTKEGVIFLEKSMNFINNLSNLEVELKNLALEKDELKIGWSNFWGSYILPDIIEKISKKYSNIYPKIYGFSTNEAIALVKEKKLDFALISKNETDNLEAYENLAFLLGKKSNFIKVKNKMIYSDSKYNNSDSITSVSLTISNIKKDSDKNIEVANLSTLIYLLEKNNFIAEIPFIIYKNLSYKENLTILKETNKLITPCLIWNKELNITKLKKSFIKTFLELQ